MSVRLTTLYVPTTTSSPATTSAYVPYISIYPVLLAQ